MVTAITRVRVTGGFLAGLDLSLGPGLNVIVGPRGAGKTTLLELMRHALALTGEHDGPGRETFLRHALGPGEIVVDLQTAGGPERLVVDAQGGGRRPELTTESVLMLGQNELEVIADDVRRRLHLIDMRAGISPVKQNETRSGVAALTSQLFEVRRERVRLQEQLRQKPSLLADRQVLRQREHDLLARHAEDLTQRRRALQELEDQLFRAQADRHGAARLRALLDEVSAETVSLAAGLESSQELQLEEAMAAEVRRLLWVANQSLKEVARIAAEIKQMAEASTRRLAAEDSRLRTEAEPIRSQLDQVERGLGTVTSQLRDLDAQVLRLESMEAEAEKLQQTEERLRAERFALQNTLEEASENLFAQRERAALRITEQLDHSVHISVSHLSDVSALRAVLARRLQGRGLQHNVLADALSVALLPTSLLTYVEEGDVEGLAAAANLPIDRSARIVGALDDREALVDLSVVGLEDSVDYRLQDGAALKSVSHLSTGQKCAVTMPIVLTDEERLVILDQPEDHLDNQFLVSRIVTSLVKRGTAGAQSIVATHNPNIPVLGSATQVASLTSDGAHGAVSVRGAFDSRPVVAVITALMEGGQAAFDYRAHFYAAHARRTREG